MSEDQKLSPYKGRTGVGEEMRQELNFRPGIQHISFHDLNISRRVYLISSNTCSKQLGTFVESGP